MAVSFHRAWAAMLDDFENFKSAESWIIERLDRKLADVIGSNIVEKCDVTLSRAIQPLTSDVLRVFNAHIAQIAHVLKYEG